MAKEEKVIPVAGNPKTDATKPKADGDLYILELPFPCFINGNKFEGKVKVTRDVAEVLVEMVQKKQQQDLNAISDGKIKKYIRLNGRLMVKDDGKVE